MKLFAFAGASLCVLLLSACATEPTTTAAGPAAAKPSPDDMICTREYPIGSNIAQNHCRTRAQVEAEREAAKDSLNRATMGQPTGKPRGG